MSDTNKRATGADRKLRHVHVRLNEAERGTAIDHAKRLGFESGKGPGVSTLMREAALDPEAFAAKVTAEAG